jgi:hypothetical protein
LREQLVPLTHSRDGRSGGRAEGQRLSNRTLISCQLLASHLSNVADMRDTVVLGTQVHFSNIFASSVQLRPTTVPGRSMVRAHQVCFDIAYLMFTGEKFKAAWQQGGGGMSRWSWADSSPQAGRDWFQCKEMHALNQDLPALAAAVDALINDDQQQDDSSAMTPDEVQACNRMIAKALRIHMKTPAAKGEGHSGTEHLAGCWALMNFWEAGSVSGLERICSEHVSFTSDMGTDSGIRGFQVRIDICIYGYTYTYIYLYIY